MRILIAGGRGMVGRALAIRLRAKGHAVTITSRSAITPEEIRLDFSELPCNEELVAVLQGYDLFINAAGMGPSAKPSIHERVHFEGACRLFDVCVAAGVPRILQISALGDPETGSFIASKHAADTYLMSLPVDAQVVRPSLIFSREGQSCRLLLSLAQLPVQALPDAGSARVQPIHIDDLADAIVAMIEVPRRASGIVELVGPRALGMAEFVRGLRASLGGGIARRIPLPDVLARLGFALLGWLGFSAGGSQTLRVLRAGSVGAADAIHAGRDPAVMLSTADVREEKRAVARAAIEWSGRLALSATCLVSALTPLFVTDHAHPLDWLGRVGLHGDVARVSFVALICLDLACAGAALLARSMQTWLAIAGVFAGYTLVMSVRMPEMWADPFGPLLKNLPMIAWALSLAAAARAEKGSTS
jgi:uncharacterized protein YbjT (DUF2867 family)